MGIKQKILKELEKRPASLRELKAKLGNDKKVAKAVQELNEKNKLVERRGRYAPAAKAKDAIECTLVKLGRTFGFAQPTDGGEDVFIPGRFLLGAMPGDTVLVQISAQPRVAGTREGEVTAVVETCDRLIGTVCEEDGRLALRPDNCPDTVLYLKKGADGGARPGEKAAVEILERGARHEDHRAGVAMRFGTAQLARHCAKAILYAQGIERHFPVKVKAEAKKFEGAKVPEREQEGREDLRSLPIFTIDGADTKDIDDAVCVQRTGYGYRLGVHIADVSHYVRPGTELDKEAFRRGTSVYYADAVVPMLPRALSNGICSLDEGKDRLAFSCIMELDGAGRVTDARLAKTVVCSRVKGVYSEVNALLDGTADEEMQKKYAPVAAGLPLLEEVYEKLAALRAARGAMDIENDEAKLILDSEGRCVDVRKQARGKAERMIEEFMLLANESVAAMARKAQLPFVYRVHDVPGAERVDALKSVLDACGVPHAFEKEQPTTLELSRLLDATRGTQWERAVHTAVLRSMAKAKYEPQPKGHFGLGLADYAHFTSPIRRCPDLAIHRILNDWLAGAGKAELAKRYGAFAAEASEQSSAREMAAMTAERDITDCYKAEYLSAHLGEEYDAVISSVASFGVYVQLENTVEGLVRAEALAGEGHRMTLIHGMALADLQTGRSYKIGDALRVKLVGGDGSSGHVDFVPAP